MLSPEGKCHLLLTPNASVARKYFFQPDGLCLGLLAPKRFVYATDLGLFMLLDSSSCGRKTRLRTFGVHHLCLVCGAVGVLIVPRCYQVLVSHWSPTIDLGRVLHISSARRGLAGCVMESSMSAYCSNKSAYVGGPPSFASCCALP